MSDVQAAAPRPVPRLRPPDPDTDRRLARLHLRMGLLDLARAELEALAGTDALGDDGLVTLAEARWRTGDLAGAGEAAQAHLRAGGESLVALVIAAEAIAAVGRPGEARRLAAQALERADVPLDRLFAGMPRSVIWPADPTAPGESSVLVSDEDRAERAAGAGPGWGEPLGAGAHRAGAIGDDPTLWEVGRAPGDLPLPAVSLAAAEEAIEAGELGTAGIHLAIALRSDPDLARAVLELTQTLAGAAPEIDLVRGDALRLTGHERDAHWAWAAAAERLAADRDATNTPLEEP